MPVGGGLSGLWRVSGRHAIGDAGPRGVKRERTWMQCCVGGLLPGNSSRQSGACVHRTMGKRGGRHSHSM